MEATAVTQLKINKPTSDVLDAIVDPDKLNKYFVSSASGPLVDGATVTWKWADVGVECTVTVRSVTKNHIVFEWAPAGGDATFVELTLEAVDDHKTLIKALERGWPMDSKGVERAVGQTAGWTHMFFCLKGYLEHGINLRA
jgi:uncharacterized protein YndB with AHSA1/START domain